MYHFKQTFFVVALLLILFSSVQAQPVLFPEPLSPRIANYEIDVALDAETRTLTATEKLIWYNKTPDTATELQFHLYLNAFRNTKSTFMIESGGTHRGYKLNDDGWGFIEIEKIRLENGADVTDRMEFIHPDNDDSLDQTVFRLPLPRPVRPNKSIVLDIDFTAKLPQPPFARTGAKEEYFFVGQWFPKIGVFQDGEWNCHQYHRNSEYFADFGVYDVKITVPAENIVGATGIRVDLKKNEDGTATHIYHVEDVHDFAWTTSPNFVEFHQQAQDVDIRLLLQKDHVSQAQRHLDAAKVAVEYFQNWYGDYPYPNLTVVDPRRGARGSGGMEYPTLITAGTFYGIPEGVRAPEMVIIHEFGHNYWYGLVASNEFEEAWLDEGINSYSECQIIDDHYEGRGTMIDLMGIKISDRQFHRASYIGMPDVDPIVQNSWDFYSFASYGTYTYQKASLILTTLQYYLGEDVMRRIMRTYFERWKFRHPTTQDFIDVANEVAGQNLDWYFDQALFTTKVLDYSVRSIFTRKVRKDKGYGFTLAVNQDSVNAGTESDSTSLADSLSSPDSLLSEDDSSKADEPTMYTNGVNVRRMGDFIFPVDIRMTFAKGDTIIEHWDGKALWKKFRYVRADKIVSAEIDPFRKIPIDVNFTNNSKTLESNSKGVNKLSVRFLFWMQFLMEQPEIMNLFSIFASVN